MDISVKKAKSLPTIPARHRSPPRDYVPKSKTHMNIKPIQIKIHFNERIETEST